MATIEEVKTAEKAMRDAEAALRAYRKRPAIEQDGAIIQQLAADLKAAARNYTNSVLSVDGK